MRRKVVPKFYKDHYSLIRSQRYATLELSRKVDFLSNIRDDMIPAMLRRWQRVGYGVEEKQKDKATLIAELE